MAQTLVAPEPPPGGPRRLTIEEFERLPDDLFPEGERVELIEGLIYTKMGQNDPHITSLRAIDAALRAIFGTGCNFSIQTPLKLGTASKPEPDLYILRGTWRDYDGRRPDPRGDVLLVVEVSDSTLSDDRSRKAPLYAAYGIPEYWIVNLRDRRVETYREPRAEGYAETRIYAEGESVPVGDGTVAVADVLPKA